MPDDVDVVIVGAGAAGIGAARRIASTGRSTLVLEASSRLGGRAYTTLIDGHALDLGCGWLHSADRNPWTAMAEQQGYAIDRSTPAWSKGQYHELRFTLDQQSAAKRAVTDWERRLTTLGADDDRAANALSPDGEWNPYVRAFCGFASGVLPERMSAQDYLAYDAACTYRNWRVAAGYGTLISTSMPSSATVRLSTPVEAISPRPDGVSVETAVGHIHARAAVLTVSSDVLAGGAIRLPHALDPWREAAGCLPLGNNEKLFLKLDGDTDLVAETHLWGAPQSDQSCDFYIRPFGRQLIECYLGGESAKVVAEYGVAAGFALAIEQLVDLLGSAITAKVTPLIGSDWSRAERVGGAYSCALPGHASARVQLARSWENRIFFAGEATHPWDFATAHGAYASGMRAAEEILACVFRGPGTQSVAPAS